MITMVLLSFSISITCGKNNAISLISNVSMEFYLSHMAIFRAVEKLHLHTLFGNGWFQYFITVLLVFVGTMVFSLCSHALIEKAQVILAQKSHKTSF
jgi:peptidoglycan/LPS O-acetylase OafA/YrhL